MNDLDNDDNDNDDNDDWEDYEDNDQGALDPVLTFTMSTTAGSDHIAELKTHLAQDPSPNITRLITEVIPLNKKQKRTVSWFYITR